MLPKQAYGPRRRAGGRRSGGWSAVASVAGVVAVVAAVWLASNGVSAVGQFGALPGTLRHSSSITPGALPPPNPGRSPPPPNPSNTTLPNGTPEWIGPPTSSATDLYQGFLGVDIRAQSPLGSAQIDALKATDVKTLRWPGGGLGDRFDPFSDSDGGAVYADNGVASPATTSYGAFVSACEQLSCKAIVTLPGEIDSPSMAARIVNYSVNTLHFTPEYWEIGNEPALWTHYGYSWSQWSTSQNVAPTPSQYASLVSAYANAIFKVEPGAPLIAPGGIGLGGNQSWVSTVVSADGSDLAGAAIHVYPAGNIAQGQSLAAWFATLNSSASLPSRAPGMANTIHNACANCSVALAVDEYGTGTLGTASISLWNGYLAAYLAAEIVQSLSLPIVTIDNFAFEGGYAGSWFNNSGTAASSYELYRALPTYLGTYARPLALNSSRPGLLEAIGGKTSSAMDDLIIVNTNATRGFSVDIDSAFAHAAAGQAWVFNGPNTQPKVENLTSLLAASFYVPRMSVAILCNLGLYAATME